MSYVHVVWVGEFAFNVDHVMSLLEAVGYNVSLSQCRTWINPFIARGAADKERVKCLRDSIQTWMEEGGLQVLPVLVVH